MNLPHLEPLESRRMLSVTLPAGAPDPRFGEVDGRQVIGFEGPGLAQVADAIQQPDGKILVVGDAGPSLSQVFGDQTDVFAGIEGDFLLVRYNADGSLDQSFGDGGFVITDIAHRSYDHVESVALQTVNGHTRIIVAGGTRAGYYENTNPVLAAYNLDGSIDETFGIRGKVVTPFKPSLTQYPYSGITSLVIDSTGGIVAAAGAGSGNSLGLARWDANGTYDRSFGMKASSNLDFIASKVALASDGSIVAAGELSYDISDPAVTNFSDFAVARLTSKGTKDNSFNKGRQVLIDQGTLDILHSLVIAPDGRILVGGRAVGPDYYYLPLEGDMMLARLNTNGTLDKSFGGDGIVVTEIGDHSRASAIAVQSDGKIIAAGFSNADTFVGWPGWYEGVVVHRFMADGSSDTTFGTDGTGTVIADFLGETRVSKLLLQPGGNIVEVGSLAQVAWDGDVPKIEMFRLTTNGTFDVSFEHIDTPVETAHLPGAVLTSPPGGMTDYVWDSILQPDGKMLLVGTSIYEVHTFGGAFPFNPASVTVTRLLSDGRLDGSFGNGGTVNVDLGPLTDGFVEPKAVTLQDDGKIVVAAEVRGDRIGIIRLLPDGTLDPSFGEGNQGWTILPISNGVPRNETVTEVFIRDNGKILVVGTKIDSEVSFYEDVAFTQFNEDGTLDTSFGLLGTGQVLVDFGARTPELVYAAVMQPDGKIVTAGSTEVGEDLVRTFTLARFNADGSLDSTFSDDGIVTTAFAVPQFERIDDRASSLVLRPDGGFIAAGYMLAYELADFDIVRVAVMAAYHSDGTVDESFGGDDGMAPGTYANATHSINALLVQPDGKIVAAGDDIFTAAIGDEGVVVARLNGDGSPDVTFGTGGTSRVRANLPDFARGYSQRARGIASSLSLTADGDILLAGTTGYYDRDTDFHVLKLLGQATQISQPLVTGFWLSDAQNGKGVEPLTSDTVIQLSRVHQPLAIRVDVSSAASVRFDLDGVQGVEFDSSAPFFLFPLSTGGVSSSLVLGMHELSATPIDANGQAGTGARVRFLVTE